LADRSRPISTSSRTAVAGRGSRAARDGKDSPNVTELKERVPKVMKGLESFADSYVVEFAGLPRAGKSECISIVEHFLRRNKVPVATPLEGARQAPEHLKESLLAYNAWTATYAIRQILEVSTFDPPHPSPSIVLLDRGLFDATAWFQCLRNRKEITEDERHALCSFLRLGAWKRRVRKVFFFHCGHDTSMEREYKYKLLQEAGKVLRTPFLKELRAAYEEAKSCYKNDFEIIPLQTDEKGMSQSRVALMVVDEIFSGILAKGQSIEAIRTS